MQRVLHLISLLALAVLLLLTVVVSLVEIGSTQNPNCLGVNRCETFVSNGGGTQCAVLFCSRRSDPNSCVTQKCAHIPSSCGLGSHYEQAPTCAADNLTASTAYYCASTGESVLVALVGPGQCGVAFTPTPTRDLFAGFARHTTPAAV
jgi:hypothetical protein